MRLLTALLVLPILGSVIIAIWPNRAAARWIAAVVSGLVLVVAVVVFTGYNATVGGIQFAERDAWLRIPTSPAFNVDYSVGVDGLSTPMVLLAGLLFFLAVLLSWNVTNRVKEYFALILALETAILGVFVSLDFFLFFLFWELELFPVYLLIGVWGDANRSYAAMKFLIYTLVGSAFMLVGILILYYTVGQSTFDIATLGEAMKSRALALQSFVFILCSLPTP